jgi:ABC-2 type transport system permease protein
MNTLIKRELSSLLCSPVAASFLTSFLVAAGLMNWYFPGNYNILDNGYATLDKFLSLSVILFIITIPALTMRSFAEEKRSKNLDVFRTRPASITALYFGKLIASWTIVFIALIATLVYVYSISVLSIPVGNVDVNELIASYLSLALLGWAFVCIGIFASSLTKNQITAFLLAILLNFVTFYGFDLIASLFSEGKWQSFISSLGLSVHNNWMQKGVIRATDLLIFFNYIALFAILTVFALNLKNKRVKRNFGIRLLVLLILNAIAVFIPDFRIDFTSDKRFSLSHYSQKLLKQASEEEKPIRFEIYLAGDLNAGFLHLQDAVDDILIDFEDYSHHNITFKFVNPHMQGNNQEEVYARMTQQGMRGITLNETNREGKTSQKIIYPYAQAICANDTLTVNLLKNIAGYTAEENLNASIENLEFELMDAIRLFAKKEPEAIAFIEGHGELPRPYVYDAEELLSKYFFVNRGQIGYNIADLNEFKAVVVAGPTERFGEREKFILDQYLMSGGRILWLIDGVYLSRDELQRNAQTPAIKNETNLDDLLFNYGIRINPVLLQDTQCTSILLTSGDDQYTTHPFYYSTLLLPSDNQPVTKDISLVRAAFASPIDLLSQPQDGAANILLTTSLQSHLISVPATVTPDFPDDLQDAAYFDKSFLPVAVSLQGKFNSAFINRPIPDSIIMVQKTPLTLSQPAKMVVVSSSDIIRNEIVGSGIQSQMLPMGYDRVSDKQYGNRQFIVNAVNWLVNDDEWLSLRTKQQPIRLLNKSLIYSESIFYAWLNILVPLVFVGAVIGIYNLYRNRKYGRKTRSL